MSYERKSRMKRIWKTVRDRLTFRDFRKSFRYRFRRDRKIEDAERLARRWKEPHATRSFLFISHRWGGGIDRHVRDMTSLLRAEGFAVFHCRPSSGGQIEILPAGGQVAPLVFEPTWGFENFARVLRALGVDHIHVHSLVGYKICTSDLIRQSATAAGIVYDMTIHDYMTVCPRLHLIDGRGRYCGEPQIAACEECIAREGSWFGTVSVSQWRQQFGRFLQGARRVFVPSADAVKRLARYYPGLPLTLRPHPQLIEKRIVLIGKLDVHKGAAVVVETARSAARMGLPLRFVIMGDTDCNDELSAIGNVELRAPIGTSTPLAGCWLYAPI